MTQFKFKTVTGRKMPGNNETNGTEYSYNEIAINYPSPFEYILAVWIFSLALEEIRQFFSDESDIPLRVKFIRYFRGEIYLIF
jgi:hypothetical protein